jgi:hypothetical protein
MRSGCDISSYRVEGFPMAGEGQVRKVPRRGLGICSLVKVIYKALGRGYSGPFS